MISLAKDAVKFLTRSNLTCRSKIVSAVRGRTGLEIGGPSAIFRWSGQLPIYRVIERLDNVVPSRNTIWADYSDIYAQTRNPGLTFFSEASDLSAIPDRAYDFVLASHVVEHLANPIKALLEWKRVVKPGGHIVMIAPDKRFTFDHRRETTTLAHMLDNFSNDIGEDDLSHLEELLSLHDLSRDPLAGTKEQFEKRSRENYVHRCVHHHVFDCENVRELLEHAGAGVLSVEFAPPCNICALANF